MSLIIPECTRTPPQSVLPPLIPLYCCGNLWRKVTKIEAEGALGKGCQIICRIIPIALLAIAATFSVVLGFGSIFMGHSQTIIYPTQPSDDAKRLLRQLRTLSGNNSNSPTESERSLVEIPPTPPAELITPVGISPNSPEESERSLSEILPKKYFGSPQIVRDEYHAFSEDIERENRFEFFAEIEPLWSVYIPVHKGLWPFSFLADAFRGPISNEVSGSDILDFVLDIDANFEEGKKSIVQRSVQCANKIHIFGTNNFNKIEARIDASWIFC